MRFAYHFVYCVETLWRYHVEMDLGVVPVLDWLGGCHRYLPYRSHRKNYSIHNPWRVSDMIATELKIKRVLKEKARLQKLKKDLSPSFLFRNESHEAQNCIQRALEELHQAELILRREL